MELLNLFYIDLVNASMPLANLWFKQTDLLLHCKILHEQEHKTHFSISIFSKIALFLLFTLEFSRRAFIRFLNSYKQTFKAAMIPLNILKSVCDRYSYILNLLRVR